MRRGLYISASVALLALLVACGDADEAPTVELAQLGSFEMRCFAPECEGRGAYAFLTKKDCRVSILLGDVGFSAVSISAVTADECVSGECVLVFGDPDYSPWLSFDSIEIERIESGGYRLCVFLDVNGDDLPSAGQIGPPAVPADIYVARDVSVATGVEISPVGPYFGGALP